MTSHLLNPSPLSFGFDTLDPVNLQTSMAAAEDPRLLTAPQVASSRSRVRHLGGPS